jgi:polysaccharide biosynthesis/export protein
MPQLIGLVNEREVLRFVVGAIVLLCYCLPAIAQEQSTSSPHVAPDSLFAKPFVETTPDLSRPALEHRDTRYKLSASDIIFVSFPLTPEFDQTINIQPDGYASLNGAREVHLEGLTTDEAITAIRAAYAKVLQDPIVAIELKDFNKPYFIVSGQVHKGGKFDLRGYTTATQAVAMAGGFEDSAKHSQVLLFRRKNDDWYEVKPLDIKKILQGHDVSEDPQIRPGDMVFVPQNFISKIKKFIPSSGMGAYFQMH